MGATSLAPSNVRPRRVSVDAPIRHHTSSEVFEYQDVAVAQDAIERGQREER
jgi:hypothetical protein